MSPPQTTRVLLRVQAKNGKFLGPAVPPPWVSVHQGSQTLFGPVAVSGGSGTVNTAVNGPLPAGASRGAIAVQATQGGPPPGAYWLQPTTGAAGVVASFELTEAAFLEFRATALAESNHPVTTSTSMWVVPGMQLLEDPGFVLTIPGLIVSVSASLGAFLSVTAKVTMMCGCPITKPTWPEPSGGPEPFWPETELEVFAVLTTPTQPPYTRKMDFTTTDTFYTSYPLPPVGELRVAVYAVQRAESNVGFAEVAVKRAK
jgi:hypothetical protein